jgi:hypothetical protein
MAFNWLLLSGMAVCSAMALTCAVLAYRRHR